MSSSEIRDTCAICGGDRDEHGPIAARAHNFEPVVVEPPMSDSAAKPSRLEEIVEREAKRLRYHRDEAAKDYGLAVAKAVVEECAKQVPTNWLDDLLTGPRAAIKRGTDCRQIEALLRGVQDRIRALAESPEPKGER